MEIDYVWNGGRVRDAIGSDIQFDYAVASHVVELTPNLIDWLNDIASVLVPHGLISLGVPDMRYTFDMLRAPTAIATIVADYLRGEAQPRAQHIFDCYANAVEVPSEHEEYLALMRGETDPRTFPKMCTLQHALKMARQAEQHCEDYLNCHSIRSHRNRFWRSWRRRGR